MFTLFWYKQKPKFIEQGTVEPLLFGHLGPEPRQDKLTHCKKGNLTTIIIT